MVLAGMHNDGEEQVALDLVVLSKYHVHSRELHECRHKYTRSYLRSHHLEDTLTSKGADISPIQTRTSRICIILHQGCEFDLNRSECT